MIIKLIMMMVVVIFKLNNVRKLCSFVGILLYLLNMVCCQNTITFFSWCVATGYLKWMPWDLDFELCALGLLPHLVVITLGWIWI